MNEKLLTDEELLILAKTNNIALDILLERYKVFVKQLCRSYFLIGAEPEDLIQEGMIGLYKATQNYNDQLIPFKAFAKLCITRQIKTALKIANRQKYKPLNEGISLNPFEDDSDNKYMINTSNSPETFIESKEYYNNLKSIINNYLSSLEQKILNLYLLGLSNTEIAVKLNSSTKSIENALNRARTKIKSNITKL